MRETRWAPYRLSVLWRVSHVNCFSELVRRDTSSTPSLSVQLHVEGMLLWRRTPPWLFLPPCDLEHPRFHFTAFPERRVFHLDLSWSHGHSRSKSELTYDSLLPKPLVLIRHWATLLKGLVHTSSTFTAHEYILIIYLNLFQDRPLT